ncbi:S66 peptidase family protein [Liquorilactobacillus capillatus]|uniref:Microcin c7 resistance mccf related protein n=1 Tax=Liquorilactobacillus capillatus DSM 19910 TaxID=1423731 RepID=A0A0R1M377_9LACO|nr:LD-carboxypeptidase [Liquorilactobacillus capillatus]KRL02177.1 microcin c7 resistance mccf related protein [Liquorilactobacillus capillatus DSM 19910]
MQTLLVPGDTVALVGSSDPITTSDRLIIGSLLRILTSWGLNITVSPLLYEDKLNNFIQKADIINQYFTDKKIKALFDVSGGNMSNSLIPYLDYNAIAQNPKLFCGYSDLTAVLNAIQVRSKIQVSLFQLKTIIWDKSGKQKELLYNSLFGKNNDLYHFSYSFSQADSMIGPLVGGNIRCFLKLAGTKYFPTLKDKILFLESHSGDRRLLFSQFHHLAQLPDFTSLNGIILGTFTAYEQARSAMSIADLLLNSLPQFDLPLAKTQQIGHAATSRALKLGSTITLRR